MTDSSKSKDGAKTSTQKEPTGSQDAPDAGRTGTFHREPFGGQRLRLSVMNKDPAYHYGWFRDQGDNLVMLRRAGYVEVSFREAQREIPEAVESADPRLRPDDVCRTHGGVGEGGIPYKLILMKQPIEFFEEDQKSHAQRNDEVDEAVYRPEFEDGKVVGNQYGEISVSVQDKE